MATRLQLKNKIGRGGVEYSPSVNFTDSSAFNGVGNVFSNTAFYWEQTPVGARLFYQTNQGLPVTITNNVPVNLTIGNQYLIKLDVVMADRALLAPTTLEVFLGNTSTPTNSITVEQQSGVFEAIVIASANIISIYALNTVAGSLNIKSLSITDANVDYLNELDLYDDIPFPITYKVDDIASPDTRSGAYSKTILIPGTKNNNKIFNHVFNIESDSVFDVRKKIDISVVRDNITQLNGILKLNRIVLNDGGQVDYEVTLYGEFTNIFSSLGEALLEDLNFNEYNHVLTQEAQYNSWGSSFVGAMGIYKYGILTNNFTETYAGNPSPNGTGYLYCLINNGKGNFNYLGVRNSGVDNTLPQFRVSDIALGFYVYEYMNKIASYAGFTIVSDFFDSAFFKKLIIPPTLKQYMLSEAQVAERLYNVESENKSLELAYGYVNSGIEQVVSVGYTDIISDATGGYTSNTWYVSKGGTYNFKASIGLRWEYSELKLPVGTYTIGAETLTLPGGTPTALNPIRTNFYLSDDSVLQIIRTRAGVATVIGEAVISIEQNQQVLDSDSGTSSTYDFNVSADNIECLPNDIIYVIIRAKHLLQTDGSPNYDPSYLNEDVDGNLYPEKGLFVFRKETGTLIDIFPTWLGNGGNVVSFPYPNLNFNYNAGGVAKLVMRENYIFYNEVVNVGVSEGTALDVNAFLPKNIKQADFFKWVLKMFNCFLIPSASNSKEIRIEPREQMLEDNYIDWSEKLDIGKPIEIEPLSEMDAGKYIFTYTNDNNDFLNNYSLDNTGVVYGTKTISFENDFLDGEKKIEIGFSPTITSRPQAEKLALPQITDKDSLPIDGNIRILFYNFADGHEPKWVHVSETGAGTTYTERYVPALSMFDDLYNPTSSLEFGITATGFYTGTSVYPNNVSYTNATLYNVYYKNYIAQLTDKNSRKITAYFNISSKDIYELNFNKLYFFDNHWCRLYAVEDVDLFSADTVKCVFLKYKDGLPFSPTTSIINGGTGFVDEIITNDNIFIERLPTLSFPPPNNLGSYNNTPDTVDGANNYVAPTAERVYIVGDNNVVLSEARMVTLINSSDNVVSSGVTNVTLIDTNGVNVTESNVTYISGVRISEGVISEGFNNLILDGGENIVQNAFTCNTIELVDGGLDKLKQFNSQTKTNKINGGDNTI